VHRPPAVYRNGQTIHFGFGGSGSFGIFSVPLTVGLICDQDGNWGTYETTGLSFGPGIGGCAGYNFGGSNASNIHDISGPFASASAFGAVALGGQVTGFVASNPNGDDTIRGIDVIGGVGFGAGVSAGPTITGVQQWGNANQ
jgi:hypothetical protein